MRCSGCSTKSKRSSNASVGPNKNFDRLAPRVRPGRLRRTRRPRIRGLEPGHTVNYQMLLRNFAAECDCAPTVDVLRPSPCPSAVRRCALASRRTVFVESRLFATFEPMRSPATIAARNAIVGRCSDEPRNGRRLPLGIAGVQTVTLSLNEVDVLRYEHPLRSDPCFECLQFLLNRV